MSELEINKEYKFDILKTGLNKNENFYSIIKDNKGNEHYFPYGLSPNKKYKLKVQYKSNGKYYFSFENRLLEEYDQGGFYDFEINDVKKFDNNKGKPELYFTVYDKLDVIRTVKPFHWQIEGNTEIPNRIRCKVTVKGNKLFLEQVIGDKVQHPIFEINELYNFEFSQLIKLTESSYNFLEVIGSDKVRYKVKSHFFQYSPDVIDDIIRCKYKGLSNNGEVLLEQEKGDFIRFRSIFENETVRREKIFSEIINNKPKEFTKLEIDYKNRENIWIFSLCEGLKNLIESKLNRYDYDGAIDCIGLLITGEKWILNSGFLTAFGPEKRDLSKTAAKKAIRQYTTLNDTIKLIIDHRAKSYIETFFNNLSHEIKDEVYQSKLKKTIDLLKYTNRKIIDSQYIVKTLNNLDEIGLLGKGEIRNFGDVVFSRVIDLRSKMFTHELPAFTSKESTKKDALVEYSKLLYIYSYLDFKIGKLIDSRNRLTQYLRSLTFSIDKKYKLLLIRESLLLLNIQNDDLDLEIYFKSGIKPPLPEEIISSIQKLREGAPSNDSSLKKIQKAKSENEEICVDIENIREGYLLVSYENIYGIIPNHLYLDFLSNNTLNEGISIKVYEVFETGKLFIGGTVTMPEPSKKDTIWEFINNNYYLNSGKQNEKEATNKICKGDEVLGIVKNVEDKIGVFVNLVAMDGLIPSNLISWERNIVPSDYFSEGQIIRSSVKEIMGDGKITLSTQVFFTDPWEKYNEKLFRDEWYVAKVINIKEYGVFFDIAPKLFGLMHVKSVDKDLDITKFFNKGDTYCVFVQDFNPQKKKITIKDFRELSPEDFSNKSVHNLWKTNYEEEDNWYIKESRNSYSNVSLFERAYTFRNFAYLAAKFESRIVALEWSKFFFSLAKSKYSYLTDYYIKYYKTIRRFEKQELHTNDLSYVDNLVTEIERDKKINQKIPIIKRVIKSLEILSLYGRNSLDSMTFLLKTAYDGSLKESIQKLARLIISNNILDFEKNGDPFFKNNKKRIVKYLNDGVIEFRELTDGENSNLGQGTKKILEIIENGEGKHVEFKSSFSEPILPSEQKEEIDDLKDDISFFKQKGNKKAISSKKKEIKKIKGAVTQNLIKHSAMRAVAAFANTDGGILLIGVNDEKKLIGLEPEYKNFSSRNKKDALLKLFDNTINNFFGNNISSCLEEVSIIKVNEYDILKIKISRSHKPLFLEKDKKGNRCNSLFVRLSASVKELDSKEAIEFVEERAAIRGPRE